MRYALFILLFLSLSGCAAFDTPEEREAVAAGGRAGAAHLVDNAPTNPANWLGWVVAAAGSVGAAVAAHSKAKAKYLPMEPPKA